MESSLEQKKPAKKLLRSRPALTLDQFVGMNLFVRLLYSQAICEDQWYVVQGDT